MRLRSLSTTAAVLATGLVTGSGLVLSSPVANAAAAAHHPPTLHRLASAKPLTRAGLTQVRARQHALASRTAPTFSRSGVTTFTVDTTLDTPLAIPTGSRCMDAAGKCSLRAAVEAANNRATPVRIVLGSHAYRLTSASALTVTNPAGTSIVGRGTGRTIIKGDGSGVFYLDNAGSKSGGVLFLSDAKVTGGAANYGAGFYLNDNSGAPQIVLDDVVVSGNTATYYGGGLYASDYNSVYATNTRFLNNVAPEGAGLYTYWANTSLRNVTISGNHTPATGPSGYSMEGAGIYNEYGVLQMSGGSISNNTVGNDTNSGVGGALYDDYGNITLSGVHLDGNTANDSGYAGAIYSDFDLISITGGTMSHNHVHGTYSYGGALYQEYGSQVDLHQVVMRGNRMDAPNGDSYGGGTIYSYGEGSGNQLTIDRSVITGSNGSAVYAYSEYGQVDLSISSTTLAGNQDKAHNGMSGLGCGGAVCAYNADYTGMNLTMTGDTVRGNSSVGDYSAGAVTAYSYYYGGLQVSLRGNLFEKNVSGPGGYGGAVGFYNDDDYNPISVRSQSNRFVSNRAGTASAPGYGGGMSLYYYAALTDHGSTFTKNVAVGSTAYGGAVSNQSYQSARFVGTSFTGNRAGLKSSGSGYGGALFTYDEGGTALSKVTMTGNRAASQGGGIYSEDYGLTIDQSTIAGNTAGTVATAGSGGGVYDSEAPLAITNSTIANNRALSITGTLGQGGGIYQDISPFDLRYSTVSGNVAQQGAGIYSYNEGGNLLSSIVSGNKASARGAERDCGTHDAYSKLHSLGGNVLGRGRCVVATQSTDKVSARPRLRALAHNGGPTETMALRSTSPAIGRGTFQVPPTDQRGHQRPSTNADAGAYELS